MNTKLALENAVARIEARLLETKTPCKLYSSSSRASAATAKVADRAHDYFGANYVARYCVLIPSVNKYAIVFDQTSLMREHGGDAAYFARQGFYSI